MSDADAEVVSLAPPAPPPPVAATHADGKVVLPLTDGPVIVGVCAMDKKVRATPMMEILKRLEAAAFHIVVFGDETIVGEAIEDWPAVHCLISFFSSGFPLEKAEAYVRLRAPYCINDVGCERLLRDRRVFYDTLVAAGVPCPTHIVCNRDGPPHTHSVLEENDDFIVIDGVRLDKPFVEKPVDAEDHNVYIYYKRTNGGGSQRLFRKVGNKSSEFMPDEHNVRRDGSFIYEKFVMTQGTDIKVYAVGLDYAHAEARKSPVVDGRVERDPTGKEVRYPIMLSKSEKSYARRVCVAFKMAVCGFDLLRTHDASFVCDVNGWSFVKKSKKYYDDTAHMLATMMLQWTYPGRVGPSMYRRVLPVHTPTLGFTGKDALKDKPLAHARELRCVVAVIRHGDRTPKQKLKLEVADPAFLALLTKHGGGQRFDKEIKLKSAAALQEVLDVTRVALDDEITMGTPGTNLERRTKLGLMKDVLETGSFSGINRKVQLKPKAFATPDGVPYLDKKTARAAASAGNPVVVSRVLLVCKWGGLLTDGGLAQAVHAGQRFRQTMYPGESEGLLRLHSTYRHDLKIYSSDEGRVQMTAAAFTKGLLALEGSHIPINASLVRSDNTTNLLDADRLARDRLDDVKARLVDAFRPVLSGEDVDEEEYGATTPAPGKGAVFPPTPLPSPISLDPVSVIEAVAPTRAVSMVTALDHMKHDLQGALVKLKDQLRVFSAQLEAAVADGAGLTPYAGESPNIMLRRWDALIRDFYSRRRKVFNISKVPDIYDCAKYDLIHKWVQARTLANIVIPQEYGITSLEKKEISSLIAHHLLRKVLQDFDACRPENLEPPVPLSSSGSPMLTAASPPPSAEAGAAGAGIEVPPLPGQENVNRLHSILTADEGYATINSPQRHVRTRLYFTSESHVHSMLNVILHAAAPLESPFVEPVAAAFVSAVPELDYLTHIVFQLFENTALPLDDPNRMQLEVSFSPGVSCSPLTRAPHVDPSDYPELTPVAAGVTAGKPPTDPHALPLVPVLRLQSGVTLDAFAGVLSGLVESATVAPPLSSSATLRPSTSVDTLTN